LTEHTYPDRHPPGSHWSTDVAWEILDVLPAGLLNEVQRAFVCGLMAAALDEAASKGPITPRGSLPKLK
jgi:hypothetical protein